MAGSQRIAALGPGAPLESGQIRDTMDAIAEEIQLRIAAFIGVIIAALSLGAIPASAATRVALVIGNSAYQKVAVLRNPVNDASDLSASLKRLDFDVKTVTNAGYGDMQRALIDFARQARGAEIAVISFGGHGIQVDGENWLIPVDAQLATASDIANQAIALGSLVNAVSDASKLGLVMLDASRSNPFPRPATRGLQKVNPPSVLVVYSARDGGVATDGPGRNSPFIQALLKHIETPGLEIRRLFDYVREDVMAATQGAQQPFFYGSLANDGIYLKPAAATLAPAAPAPNIVAPPGRRVALVIGNSAYKSMPSLTNPKNDAVDIESTLKSLGFETVMATDLDRLGMNATVSRFARIVTGADLAMVYYSGHGMQFNGKNYLLPTDANLESASDVNRFTLMPVDDVVEMLGSAKGLQLIVLDACRNNPVERDFKNKLASVAGGNRDAAQSRGFSRIDARSGLLVTYATAANDVASDGDGRNSPFTKAFLKNVVTPDLEVRQMLYRVQSDVYAATGSKQLPEISSLYVGPDIRFKQTGR